MSVTRLPYASRVGSHRNPAAREILSLMDRKKTNLCVSVDVTTKADLLAVVESVAPFVCMVKTHIDIVEDFDHGLIDRLQALSKEHDFIIFEDRKFADIGNTVALQYSSGVHRIASWSHITNAHMVPGPGIISGLSSVGRPLGRGLLLLAEMSSKGNLAQGQYQIETVREARRNRDDSSNGGFVIGFIAMNRVELTVPPEDGQAQGDKDDFLILTPGVALDVKGDSMGQQYRTPRQVIHDSGCDVIIVGRAIYGPLLAAKGKGTEEAKVAMEQVRVQAEKYRTEGWSAYEDRIKS